MEITGKVHCFFEQSGTFKNEFLKLGIPAEDYDIQNNFGQTDHIDDLFLHIESAYMGGASLFDNIDKQDLIIAFFPCIYFESLQMPYYSLNSNNLKKDMATNIRTVINRVREREKLYTLLYKLICVVYEKGLRLIIENPSTQPHYLLFPQNFIKPTVIDNDRTKRGDFFKKPTAYWFINCENTIGYSYQLRPKTETKRIKDMKSAPKAGLCSEERSMISPDYARNFICDFVLGRNQKHTEQLLFKF